MVGEKVYCIVVTHNGMPWIKKCLDSLIASSHKNHIIIIDNNSTDNTPAYIRDHYPCVELMKMGKNLGFGQGNNFGLTRALIEKADFAFLLNQDAFVEEDTIASLVKCFRGNAGYGILSPVHMNGTGSGFDHYFYKYFLASDLRPVLNPAILKTVPAGEIINTSFVNAAAWLISRDCLEKTGGFDPIFFHYGEDDNYAQRAIFNGFKIGILSTAKMFHERERSDSKQVKNSPKDVKKDRILFLNQACDPHLASYKILVTKRFLRYCSFTILNLLLLNIEDASYNFSMAKNIVFSLSKIKKSRNFYRNTVTPYLEINAGHE